MWTFACRWFQRLEIPWNKQPEANKWTHTLSPWSEEFRFGPTLLHLSGSGDCCDVSSPILSSSARRRRVFWELWQRSFVGFPRGFIYSGASDSRQHEE